MPRPFILPGQSRRAAASAVHTARDPDHVNRLVLLGGFVRGAVNRGDPRAAALFHAVIEVFRHRFDGDMVVQIDEGHIDGRSITDFEFNRLSSNDHIPQDEQAWDDYTGVLLARTARSAAQPAHGLTARGVEIFNLISLAKSNKAIASDLEISERTVRNHMTRISAKLGVTNRQGLS